MIRLTLLLLLLATGAVAQDIPVRSGNHPGFTRLAIFLGSGAGWTLGRTPEGYGLLVDRAEDFDIARVFDTIPRDRLGGLTTRPGRLDLALACDCHANVFRHGEGWLVVDILPGPGDPAASHERPLERASLTQLRGNLPLITPRGAEPVLLPAPLVQPAAPDPRTSAIMQQMAEGIARGAAQGLLDLATPRQHPVPAGLPDEAIVRAEDLLEVPTDLPPGLPGVAAHTSVDRDLVIPGLTTAPACLPESAFDLAAWAGSGDYAHEIGQTRAALTIERDRMPPDAVEALARSYLAFGFGREAAQILALDGLHSRDRDVLLTIARIVDGDPAPQAAALADQAGCGGAVVLWRALALSDVAGLTSSESTALMTAFRLLPQPLRGQIAPRLAAIYARAGDALAADEILQRAQGADSATTATSAGAEVAASLAAGDAEAALDRLTTLVEADVRAGPEEVVALIDLAIAEQRALAPSDLALLRALRFEYRTRPEDVPLAMAEGRLLSSLGDHAAALAVAASIPLAERGPIVETILLALASEPDDAVFLDVYFGAVPEPVSADAANALGARLIALGFPDQALGLLSATTGGSAMAERRYLRAAAAAALGRADLVEAELLGLTDDRAMAIRAAVAGADPGSDSAAWRAADWPQLSASDDPLLRAASDAVLASPPGPADLPPLAARAALIDEAEAARRLARDLLDRFSGSTQP